MAYSEEQYSRQSGDSARRAITHYARAAAFEEKCDSGNSAGQMWFVVRALCAEHGISYETTVKYARQFVLDMSER